jgi:hypothetical protein
MFSNNIIPRTILWYQVSVYIPLWLQLNTTCPSNSTRIKWYSCNMTTLTIFRNPQATTLLFKMSNFPPTLTKSWKIPPASTLISNRNNTISIKLTLTLKKRVLKKRSNCTIHRVRYQLGRRMDRGYPTHFRLQVRARAMLTIRLGLGLPMRLIKGRLIHRMRLTRSSLGKLREAQKLGCLPNIITLIVWLLCNHLKTLWKHSRHLNNKTLSMNKGRSNKITGFWTSNCKALTTLSDQETFSSNIVQNNPYPTKFQLKT